MRAERDRRDDEVREYFAARAQAMRRTAYVVVRDWHTAEDMVQLTFLQLYTHWPRIRRETVDGYARRTLVNQCLSHLRKHRREHPTDVMPDGHSVDPMPGLDTARTLAVLPPQQRAIVALRFLDDLPVAEVAAALGIAEGTVKSQTSRALATLRRHVPHLELEETR